MHGAVIHIPKRPGGPFPDPPANGHEVYATTRVRVWALGGPPGGRWSGRRLRDGCLVGATASAVDRAADVAGTFGAYLLIRDSGRSVVAVSRDPSGRIPAYWADRGDHYLVASDLTTLLASAGRPASLDIEYLALVAAGLYLPGRRTAVVGVEELLGGEEIRFGPDGVTRRLAWSPATFAARPYAPAAQAQADLRDAAERSVAFWAQKYDRATLDLSGGLDSSVLLGLLCAAPRRPELTCMNAMAEHAESDERGFAREAAARYGVALVEHRLESATVRLDVDPGHALQPRPTSRLLGIGFGGPGLSVARAAGAQAYFTGRGGDHVFYAGLPSTASADHLAARRNLFAWLRFAYLDARRTGETLFSVLKQPWRGRDRAAWAREVTILPNRFVAPDALSSVDVNANLHPWLVDALAEAPTTKVQQVINLLELQRHHDRVGRAEVLDEVHPFISQPVFEASLGTASVHFALGGRDRGLQRAAFRDLLPASVADRREKGATTNHSLKVYRENLPFLRSLLLDGRLAAEGVLRRELLESALTPLAIVDGRGIGALRSCLIAELWIHRAQERLQGADAALRSLAS